MKMLIDQLFIDWNELETLEEYEIMKKYAKNSRRYSLGYSCKNELCDFNLHSNKQEKLPIGAIAIISAYSCRINNYNISSGDKLMYFAANEHFDSRFESSSVQIQI